MNKINLSIGPTYCKCHPETCCCNPWSVYEDGKKLVSFFHKDDAQIYMLEKIVTLQEDQIKNLQNKIKSLPKTVN